jgi:hypothetical protein
LAISFYKAALEVHTHEAFPEQWAMTQSNLGGAYWQAGQISEMLAAIKAGLRVFIREEFPGNWAENQMCLGIAYTEQGQFSEAIAAQYCSVKKNCRLGASASVTQQIPSNSWVTLREGKPTLPRAQPTLSSA